MVAHDMAFYKKYMCVRIFFLIDRILLILVRSFLWPFSRPVFFMNVQVPYIYSPPGRRSRPTGTARPSSCFFWTPGRLADDSSNCNDLVRRGLTVKLTNEIPTVVSRVFLDSCCYLAKVLRQILALPFRHQRLTFSS